MYIIKLQITSANNQYSFSLTSTAILVKQATSKFEIFLKEFYWNWYSLAVLDTYSGYPPSNITYATDYYTLQANNQLELIRCAIYNYLFAVLVIPITSNIVLAPGLFLEDLDFVFT